MNDLERKEIEQSRLDLQLEEMQNVLKLLRAAKPNDRSEMDRRYAVTITEFEKVIAYFEVYVVNNEK